MINDLALYRDSENKWHETPAEAGFVTAVICKHCRDGVERQGNETLEFIKKVASFWSDHDCVNSENFITFSETEKTK